MLEYFCSSRFVERIDNIYIFLAFRYNCNVELYTIIISCRRHSSGGVMRNLEK